MKHISCFGLITVLAFCSYSALGAPLQNISTIQAQLSDQNNLAEFNTLANKARHEGRVKVLVVLKETFNDKRLLKNQIQGFSQLKNIAIQQNALLTDVPIRRSQSIKRFSHLPFLALAADESELQRLRSSPRVAQIFEDHINFPAFHELSIAQIGADAAWGLGYTGIGQTIAILDNGIDKHHPLLLNKVVAEACFSTRDSKYHITPLCRRGRNADRGSGSATVKCKFLDFACTHGTFVAGLAAGNSLAANYVGSGVAPQATLLAVKVVSLLNNRKICGPTMRCQIFFDSDVLQGLNLVYRLRHKLNISSVNLSLGANVPRRSCNNTPIRRMVAKLRTANIATIAASGNEGLENRLNSPACIPGVISVGATNNFDAVSWFSNSAASLALLAPGENIGLPMPGVVPPGYEVIASGTSLPTAFVSGAWAALKSHKPNATVDEILSALTNTGVPVYDARNGLVRSRIRVNLAHNALGI